MDENYLDVNRESWNKRTEEHWTSDFYDNKSFIEGKTSLNDIELPLLGNIEGKSVLHLQCHFGQDTISLERMGAQRAMGVDLSDVAIEKARLLANKCDSKTEFLESDVFELPKKLEEKFDIVFTSYGTIGWLPDIHKWADVVSHFLKPKGQFVFVEFHPVVWMFDDDFTKIQYAYHKTEPIVETSGTYTESSEGFATKSISWNHGLSEVMGALLSKGLSLNSFKEYNYSPYNCFDHTEEIAPSRFRIKHLGDKIPMVYSLVMQKD